MKSITIGMIEMPGRACHGRKIAYISEVLGPEQARARFLGRRRGSPAGVAFAASQSDPRTSIVHSVDVIHMIVYFYNE
jgi:hypothetical protein